MYMGFDGTFDNIETGGNFLASALIQISWILISLYGLARIASSSGRGVDLTGVATF